MDHKLTGLLRRYVLFLTILELHLRPAFSAPAPAPVNCTQLGSIKSQAGALKIDAVKLQREYKELHRTELDSVQTTPGSEVSGNTNATKLLDIYSKSLNFFSQLLKVEDHQVHVWGNPKSIRAPLDVVKNRLKFNSEQIKDLLDDLKLSDPLPLTPTPPPVTLDHDYARKEYDWKVIVNLRKWCENVESALKGAEAECRGLAAKS